MTWWLPVSRIPLHRHLRWAPGLVLVLAVLMTASTTTANLAAWEPFNAYIWAIAGFSSLCIAVSSLLISASVPMAYCRYACGTGRLLKYLRRTSHADRFQLADGVAVLIAATLWLYVGFGYSVLR